MDIYLTASQFGKYPGLATSTSVNNCYVIVCYMVCLSDILTICREFKTQPPADLSLCRANFAIIYPSAPSAALASCLISY